MQSIYRLGLVFLVLVSCVGCDQAAKGLARESLLASPPISLWNDSIHVEYTENAGAILGLGATLPREARFLIFAVLVGLVLAATLVFAVRTHSMDTSSLLGLACVAAGGVGNLLDRVFNEGRVIDFVRLGIGPFRTAIFNVADVAIMVGGILFLLSRVSARGKAKEKA